MYNFFDWTEESKNRNRILTNFEPVQPFLFLEFSHFMSTDLFLDIGANIGAYSIFFSKLKTVKQIIAFEADAESFDVINTNIELNNLGESITTICKAVSQCVGYVEFGNAGRLSGVNAIINTSFHNHERYTPVDVESTNIDTYNFNNRMISIKIDVEGHEFIALQGMYNTLVKNVCLLQCECYRRQEETISEYLESLGYRKIFKCGPDVYFTNNNLFYVESNVINCVEKGLADLISYTVDEKPVLHFLK